MYITHADGEAKFWLEPSVELAQNHGFDASHIDAVRDIILEHQHAIRSAWRKHFEG